MSAAAPESKARTSPAEGQSIKSILAGLHERFAEAADRQLEPEFFEEIASDLARLHAQFRIQHTAGQFTADVSTTPCPELAEEFRRLQDEHSLILGKLDRLVRCVDSMADRTLEDKEVFFLRGQELIALLRRHEAEEDRIFYLSVWRDTGGES